MIGGLHELPLNTPVVKGARAYGDTLWSLIQLVRQSRATIATEAPLSKVRGPEVFRRLVQPCYRASREPGESCIGSPGYLAAGDAEAVGHVFWQCSRSVANLFAATAALQDYG